MVGGWGAVAEKQELNDAANAVKTQVEIIEPEPSKPMVGGFKAGDKDELAAAANAVKDEAQNMDDEKFTDYEVVSGTKQVVAGMNYQIKVKVGINKFVDIKVYRSLPPIKYELKSAVFTTTETPKLGGWGKAADKDEMTDAANAVRSQIEKQANDMGKPIKMYEVVEGRKQVVAGMN
eukprot:901841_1